MLVSQTSFRGEISGGFGKCRLFSEAMNSTANTRVDCESLEALEKASNVLRGDFLMFSLM